MSASRVSTTHAQRQGPATSSGSSAPLMGAPSRWYDFFLYGVAAAAVFHHVFFPNATDPLQATLLESFATYWVSFFFRPLGGLVSATTRRQAGAQAAARVLAADDGRRDYRHRPAPLRRGRGARADPLLTVLRCVQGFAIGGSGVGWRGAHRLRAR